MFVMYSVGIVISFAVLLSTIYLSISALRSDNFTKDDKGSFFLGGMLSTFFWVALVILIALIGALVGKA